MQLPSSSVGPEYNARPISDSEIDHLANKFTDHLLSIMPLQELSEKYAKIVECNKIIAQATQNQAEAELKLAALKAKELEVNQKLAALNAKELEADQKLAALNAKELEADEKLKEIEIEAQNIMTRQFYSIFTAGKMDLAPEQTPEVFQTYLADRSVVVVETSDGDYFSRINSMTGVIKYLDEHTAVRTCDFRRFKAEINDIETFTQYLVTHPTIRAVAFLDNISDAAKAALAEAQAARATSSVPLNVRYFPALTR